MTLPDFYTKNVLVIKNIFRDEKLYLLCPDLFASQFHKKIKILESIRCNFVRKIR